MTRLACPSTEQIQTWWTQMQTKGASKLYAVQDDGIYRLRAFTANRKKCGELSLGLKDKRLANRIAVSMAVTIDDNSPGSVINKYIEHLKLHKKACETGRHILTTLAQSAEHNIKTIKSRLSAHLVPFCFPPWRNAQGCQGCPSADRAGDGVRCRTRSNTRTHGRYYSRQHSSSTKRKGL